MSEAPQSSSVFNSQLGQELEPEECDILAGIMQSHSLTDGEILVTEGQTNSALSLLADGKLSVISRIEETEQAVYTMKASECAGTRSFIDRAPRRATLKAVGSAVVYTMEPDAFESLLQDHPVIVYKVMRALFRITHRNLMRMNVETQELSNYIHKTGGRY